MTYQWYINGVLYADSESITVPASAASGDRIRVIVTDEEGNTAEDTVYVGGFTIVEVEPTTAVNTAAGDTYKYIRATFSEALSSLDPSEIEIRRKSDKQLYSVESVRLSSDGTIADITLFGDKDAAGTQFLEPATIYIMTVNHDGFSDDLEFQLPDNQRDLIVTSVDVENGIIVTVDDGRTSNPAGGQFTVGDAYLGNLGYLVGRNVVVGSNADRELMNFSIEDQSVVIAKVKYVEKDAVDNDKNYFETPDETKYYLTDDATTTVAATQMYDAKDGTVIGALVDGDEFQYAKLVLNKNGRVATAVLQGATAWDGHIIVTETDDTQVIESSDFALDFDGYTIVKNDEYVEVADLEVGDIVYYNATDKFADVYTETVTGNIEKINSEKITIDGTAYKWAGAQYLKSNKYVTLDQTDIESDLAYLYSLDEDEDTTIVLNRKGDIQVIDGTVKDEVKTTSSVYVLTEDGAQYAIGKKEYIELVGSDGTQETLVIDISTITSYAGKDSGLNVTGGTAASGTSFYDKTSGTTITTATTFTAGRPVKITKDSDGVVVGIDLRETAQHVGSAKLSDGTTDQTIDADSTSLYVAANDKITLKSSTPVYIVNDKADDDGVAPFKVEKTTIGELTKTANGNRVAAWAKSSSTSAEYVLIDNTRGDAWTTTDTETVGGVVTGVTKGLNTSSGKEEVESITLLTASGKVELDADELGYTTDYTPGKYITFTLKKDTTTLAAEAADADEFAQITLDAARSYSDSKFVNQYATVTVSKASPAKVFVYDPVEDSYTETNIGAVNTKKVEATLDYHVVDSNTAGVVTSDVMVVTYTGRVAAATITLDSSALAEAITAATAIGLTVEDDGLTGGNLTYKLQSSADGKTAWADVDNLTLAAATGILTTSAAVGLTANTYYRIIGTPAIVDQGDYANAFSANVKTAAAAFTSLTITQGTYEIAQGGLETAASAAAAGTTLVAVDQWGNTYTPDAAENVTVSWAKVAPAGAATTNVADLTGNLTIATTGAVTFTPQLSVATPVDSTWSAEIEGTTYYVQYTTKWATGATDGVLTLTTAAPANPA